MNLHPYKEVEKVALEHRIMRILDEMKSPTLADLSKILDEQNVTPQQAKDAINRLVRKGILDLYTENRN
jgi:DNA-binding MarR family transcriptional regulator